jgi:hypothetical protein
LKNQWFFNDFLLESGQKRTKKIILVGGLQNAPENIGKPMVFEGKSDEVFTFLSTARSKIIEKPMVFHHF